MVDYDYGFRTPVVPSRAPRPDYDYFNAPLRIGYNPNYRYPGDPVGHKGVDLAAAAGSPVVAPARGVVRFAGQGSVDAGWLVEILHPDPNGGWYLTRSMHLSEAPSVIKGQKVEQGEQVGKVGKTGNANYYHDHFEIRWTARPDADQWTVYGSSWATPYDPLRFGILNPPQELPVSASIAVTVPVLRRVYPYPAGGDDKVRRLQALLAQGGWLNTSPGVNFNVNTLRFDGKFGPSTEVGVKALQLAHRQATTGVADGAVWKALVADG